MSDIEKVALLTSDEIDNLRWRRYIDNEKGITTPYGQDVDRLLSHIAALSAARPNKAPCAEDDHDWSKIEATHECLKCGERR